MKGGKKEDEYLRRMETAVSNAHVAMKLLKDENSKLKERVNELERKLLQYEERQISSFGSPPPQQHTHPDIRENPRSIPSVRTTELPKKISTFARPNFTTGNGKGGKEEVPVSQRTKTIQQETKLTPRNQKRER
jgi:hypothetical protein